MHTLKQVPEDFAVEEVFSKKFLEKGDFAVFKLTKKNRNSEDVMQEIARRLNIDRKRIGYAGIKDKNAVTTQFISVFKVNPQKLLKLDIHDVSIDLAGYLNEPITLGSHEANRFVITIRNIDDKPAIEALDFIPNYFDEQRFSMKNPEIGKHIVKKRFKAAVELIIETNPRQAADLEAFLHYNRNNYVGALRLLPKKNLLLYIHSYQSFIFNKILCSYLQKKRVPCNKVRYSQGDFLFPKKTDFFDDKKAPLVGFGTEVVNNELKGIISDIMKKEGISIRDFIVRELPEFSQEGNERDLFVKILNFKSKGLEDDELNKGKKKFTIEFFLPKGSYATIVVKAIFLPKPKAL